MLVFVGFNEERGNSPMRQLKDMLLEMDIDVKLLSEKDKRRLKLMAGAYDNAQKNKSGKGMIGAAKAMQLILEKHAIRPKGRSLEEQLTELAVA